MSYVDFQSKVGKLMSSVGDAGLTVRFFNDTDKGMYGAVFSDGTKITQPYAGLRATVRFGSGHQCLASI